MGASAKTSNSKSNKVGSLEQGKLTQYDQKRKGKEESSGKERKLRSIGSHIRKHSEKVTTKQTARHDQEEQLSSLDAIAEDSNSGARAKEFAAAQAVANRDAVRLSPSDIFHDSPNGSPLSASMPQLWETNSRGSVVE